MGALTADRLRTMAAERAAEIHCGLQQGSHTQVRWHKGRFLTYRYPAPRGYGVRGELVAVYGAAAKREWIETDLIEFAQQFVSDTNTPDFACSL